MSTAPAGRAAVGRATSDTAAPLSTATTPDRPTVSARETTVSARETTVSAREIAELLSERARFRSPALGGDPAEHAALLARKTELLDRIAAQHTRTADPTPTTPERRTP